MASMAKKLKIGIKMEQRLIKMVIINKYKIILLEEELLNLIKLTIMDKVMTYLSLVHKIQIT